jgi:6,7-dimethyl-8-ribityllumazine synthase
MSHHIGIVASRFNEDYTDGLLKAAVKGLAGHRLTIVRVPGSFEIPLAAQRLLRDPEIEAVIALGVIWLGQTAHADLIAREVSRALMDLMLQHDKPVLHQVLNLRTQKQARERCLGKKLNRGREAAEAALAVLAPQPDPKPRKKNNG